MKKLMKNTIIITGILLCAIILIINIFVTAKISNDIDEIVTIEVNRIVTFIITIMTIIILYNLLDMAKEIELSKKQKKIALIVILAIYLLLQIVWINTRGAIPSSDQKVVYNAATKIANGEIDTLVKNEYFQALRQQLTLPTFFALIFKITGSQSPVMLQYLNAIANTCTILAIFLITKQLGKKYEVRKINSLIISASFLTLPLLSTFVYGDLIGLPLCLFAIYFIMKYVESKKIKNVLISMALMAIAYVVRMNNLIFIIALSIYLLLDILNTPKEKLFKGIAVLVLFVTISMLPSNLIKQYLVNRLQLDDSKKVPSIGYICMAMGEGYRAYGWYNSKILQLEFDDAELVKQEYKKGISERLKTFITNPIYCIKFYATKTATMWAENTYAALWYNQSFNFGEIEGEEQTKFQKQNRKILDDIVMNLVHILNAFQKAIVLIIFGYTAVILIKNRKDISNEVLLLVTVFIGGFLFHTIWEAKSRYIIPYIVVLIPIVSLPVEDYINNKIDKIKNKKWRKE